LLVISFKKILNPNGTESTIMAIEPVRYQQRIFEYTNAAVCVQYPVVEKGMRFLNSGGFLGPLDQVAELLTAGGHIENTDDDQLFYIRHVPTFT
jgi:hypothetical protein